MKRTLTQISDSQIKHNLSLWFTQAKTESASAIEEGLKWYADAQDFSRRLAEFYGITPYKVAAVISALSPNNKWDRNKFDAENVLKVWANGKGPDSVKVCTYTSNKIKAFKILTGENGAAEITAKSPKTHSFAMNVGLLSADHITIDKWMIRAALCRPMEGVQDSVESCTAAQYRRLEAITAQVAKDLGLKGYELQAIVWVMIKKEWDR